MTGTVNAYNIYYGNISSSTKNLVNYFAANLGSSSWYNTLTSYYQIVNGVKTYVSKSFVFKQSVDVPASTAQTFNLSDVNSTLFKLFDKKRLPVDTNAVYTIFFRGDLPASFINPGNKKMYWLKDYCGYHGGLYLKDGRYIKFAVVGDPSYAGVKGEGCEEIIISGTANGNLGADSMVTVYAHEIAETITNYANAWYFNSNQFENADACSWDFGDYTGNSNVVLGNKKFLVQRMWVPTKGCVISL
eukprot:CAMPEP_0170076792 /NCGR_PEP_ID=MMETSP0019_2-20121128/13728_1 /TAXON_ID=98059 /ORGANISM="Dinobryon sp., Strain UTEXLB2267" /LENGTH=244 /DNA_ID=CAMNT_0010288713 /DNA_START=344 /DNA_END=1078 /DNA_ORIENTATION=-